MIPSLGQAASILGLQGMGDQAALQAKQEEDLRRKKGLLQDPNQAMGAIQTIFGTGPKAPPVGVPGA